MIYIVICLYQVTRVVFNYLKYEIIANVVLDSYEKVGVMPRIEFDIDHAENKTKSIAKNLSKGNIKCLIILNNKSRIHPNYVRIKQGSSFFPNTLTYIMGNSRRNIKSLNYQFNISRLVSSDNGVNIFVYSDFYTLEKNLWYYGTNGIFVHHETFEYLGPPFENVCQHESEDLANDLMDARKGCMIECFEKEAKRKLNCMWKKEAVYFSENYSFSSISLDSEMKLCSYNAKEKTREFLFNQENSCLDVCKPLCVDRQYRVKSRYNWDSEIVGKKLIVNLEFANDFAVVYKSIPKMKLFDLFYETCSLASLWLGFSILNIPLLFAEGRFNINIPI